MRGPALAPGSATGAGGTKVEMLETFRGVCVILSKSSHCLSTRAFDKIIIVLGSLGARTP